MRTQNLWKMAFLLFFIATIIGCDGSDPAPASLADVRYSKVVPERITITRNLPGRVSALMVSEVRPQVGGIILKRLFEEGTDVVRGQVLYQIDPAVYQATYDTAKATLAEATANVTSLALLEKRYRELVKTKAISHQDLDNAISDHGQARARVNKAKAELESAAINLAYTQIKAPITGRIGVSSVTPGALVTAHQALALAIIRQTNRVYVDFSQSSVDTIRLRRSIAQGKMSATGNATRVRLNLEDGSPYTSISHNPENNKSEWIDGALLFSELSVERATGTVALRAVFDNPDALLLPGMYVRATIEEGELDNVILIPQSSVVFGNSGEHSVFILKSTDFDKNIFEVERQEIILDRPLGNRWLVKAGLHADNLLIIEGLQKVIPGAKVKGISVSMSER